MSFLAVVQKEMGVQVSCSEARGWFPPQKPVWFLPGTSHCEEKMHKSRYPDDRASRTKQSPR